MSETRRSACYGLAGRLPGPPLKEGAGQPLHLGDGEFGRAIARPSIEG